MKLLLVWICLVSEAFPLPKQSPDVNDTEGCCEQNPKLVYKGHTSTRGLNVYVFELLPENKEAKDKRVEDDQSAFQHTENTEDHEDTIIPTNKPPNIKAPDTEARTRSNTDTPNLKLDTNDNTKGSAQNDVEMYGDTGFVPNTTEDLKGAENREDNEGTVIPTNKPSTMYGKKIAPNEDTGTRGNTPRPNVQVDINESTKSAAQNDIEMYGDTVFIPSTTEGLKGPENREDHEDTIIPTNNPASMYGKKIFPNRETSIRSNTHRPNMKFDAKSTISATQNDIRMYENTDFLSNATEALQTGMSYARDVQTNGYSNGPDYYGTEGSALFDIPGYNDTDNQGPQVDFPANVNDSGCAESEGQCKNLPKSEEHIFVTQPTTHKDSSKSTTKDKPDRHTKRERNSKKKSTQPKKANKPKHEKQTPSTTHTKDIPTGYNTGKTFQYSRGQRRNMGANRQKHYRSSSSESTSDSSQEFN